MSTSTLGIVKTFRALHHRERPLLLPNAWDAASAAIARSIGAEAVATSSAALAWTLGYPDGALPSGDLHNGIRAVMRGAGTLPVTVDLEVASSDGPDRIAALAGELRALGVAGIILADGGAAADVHERKIAAIKSTLHAASDDIFINARTDVYLRGTKSGAEAVREAIERAQRYEAAGADGMFVPFLSDLEAIATIAAATSLPLNILASPALPSVRELFALGVRRLSAGPTVAERAYGAGRAAARAFLESGEVSSLFSPESTTYAEMNAFFSTSSAA